MTEETKPALPEPTRQQPPRLPWPPVVAVIFVIVTYLVASVLGEVCLLLYGLVNHWSVKHIEAWLTSSNVAQFFNVVIVYAALAGLTFWFLRGHKVPLKAVGMVKPKLRDLGVMIVGVPVYILGYAALLMIASALFPSINPNQQQQLGFNPGNDTTAMVLTFFSLVVLPPLVEEFVMRGFLFTSLLKRYKFIVAALITSVLFATAHLQIGSGAPLLWVAAIDTFVLSLVLCFMRYKTGSLWPGILLHAAKNTVAFLALFVFHIS